MLEHATYAPRPIPKPVAVEAISATGANKIQEVWHAVVPQIVLPFPSYTIYWCDVIVRISTIIGLVGEEG